MKLTNRTTPQAKNHQCNICKRIFSHINMYDINICYNCFDKKVNKMNQAEQLFEKVGFWNMPCVKISDDKLLEKMTKVSKNNGLPPFEGL